MPVERSSDVKFEIGHVLFIMLHEINRRDVITNLLVWISGILENGA